jgi:histone deacetylase complex subunit SAP130
LRIHVSDPARPDSRGDAGSSSGSTTLSASSPPADNAVISGDEAEAHAQPSPRKKPRKQQLSSFRENSLPEAEEEKPASNNGGVSAANHVGAVTIARRRPRASLLAASTGTWRARYNHFLRYSDVRRKDDRKPTVNEIANEPLVMQRVNGWKMHYVSSQMEEILDLEIHFKDILSSLLKRLDAAACKDMTKDVNQVHEIIKANLQRCKIIHDQVRESKDHSMSLFEHKNRVKEILNKYLTRRQIKKKER